MKLSLSRYRTSSFIVAYVTLFLSLTLFGYYASGKFNLIEQITARPHRLFVSDMGFYMLQPMTVSMTIGESGGAGPRLRLEIILEVAHKDTEVIAGYEPHIIEKINAYLLTLKPEDMRRDDVIPWLRGELLQQINSVGAPVPVHNLYFQQFVLM